MKKFILFSIIFFTFFVTNSAFAQKPVVTVYTYDSFASEWGPGPKLEANFEKICQCDLKFIAFDDGITMFNRLRLEGKKTKADLILGLDNFLINEAEKSSLFMPHNLPLDHIQLADRWQNPIFYPYDYGEYAFIYNKKKLSHPPKSLKELISRNDLKVIYQDPRTSTVGRGLLFWVNAVYGDEANQAWSELAKHTVTIGKGWSETYGAFLKGESDLVLSYTTSPLYHYWNENNEDYVAAPFSEGHIAQIEVGAILKSATQPGLARQFLSFLHQEASQKIIAFHNIMKPVIVSHNLNELFLSMPTYQTLNFVKPDDKVVQNWLLDWQKTLMK